MKTVAPEPTKSVWWDVSILRVVGLGFASGLPILLVFSTLSARLLEAGLSLSEIGWFALAGSAYVFKFAWAPLLDGIKVPLLSSSLGRRRSWLILSQLAVGGAILGLGSTDPALNLGQAALWAVALAFASATQDIAADAYRIESLSADQQGMGAAAFVNGYRIGVLASGAGALIIADHWGWFQAYAVMAGFMGVGVLTTLLSPEAAMTAVTVHNQGFGQKIRESVVQPFMDFLTRPYAWIILLFIVLFQFGEGLLGLMANPFYLDIGFTKTEIGLVTKGWGLAMSLVGAFIGGWLTLKMGLLPALLTAGVLQASGNLAFAWLAWVGPDLSALTLTIAIENLTGAMAVAAFVGYLSGLTNQVYTATQYALLSAAAALGRKTFAVIGGEMAEAAGWVVYFGITALAAIPALLILVWLMRQVSKPQAL